MSTKMKQVPIDEATDDELREFATNILGINLGPNPNVKTETVLAKIKEAWSHPHIMVPEEDAEAVQNMKGPMPQGGPSPEAVVIDAEPDVVEPIYEIMVSEGEGRAGKRPVFVAVNATAILVPRGRPCLLKKRYVDALKLAVETLYDEDPETHEISERNVPSYPYQILKSPSDEEIARWQENNHENPGTVTRAA